jgi:hypothetical protein
VKIMTALGWAIAFSTAALAAPTDQEAVDGIRCIYEGRFARLRSRPDPKRGIHL